MIRINMLTTHEDIAHRAFYRWWTVRAGRDYAKLGPVTLCWYRWFDDRMRVGVTVLGGRERILWGGPLA